MRTLGTALLLAAFALSVYNAVQLQKLSGEVAALRASAGPARAQASSEVRARELLKESALHSERAQELMRKGQVEAARVEMQKSMDLMSEAARESGQTDLVRQIRDTAGKTAQRIEGMLHRGKGQGQPERSSP